MSGVASTDPTLTYSPPASSLPTTVDCHHSLVEDEKGEKGDVVAGDWLCFLSWNKPVWFAVRESGIRERETRVLESENGLD
uniref:Uncharacterized protein n=1 Tax=Fagus sylvatica TaxID=28930 RepID=A0A2N9GWK3_FAGSY